MKTTLIFLLLTGCCYAQMPGALMQTDAKSIEQILPGSVPTGRMPIVRPSTSFYRLKTDPGNVVRATTDNMPVKVPDSSTYYAMMHASRSQYRYEMKPFAQPVVPLLPVYPPRKRP